MSRDVQIIPPRRFGGSLFGIFRSLKTGVRMESGIVLQALLQTFGCPFQELIRSHPGNPLRMRLERGKWFHLYSQ